MANRADTTEIWKSVPGYPGYEASSLGRIRSLDRMVEQGSRWGKKIMRFAAGRVLKQHGSAGRYLVAVLSGSDGNKTRTVHSVICATFHGPRPEGREVAHTDGNARNNAACNLRWATKLENAADRRRHGTQVCGSAIHTSRLTENQVREMRKAHLEGVSATEVALDFGIHVTTAHRILSGIYWTHI
jgi:hypothetical protein